MKGEFDQPVHKSGQSAGARSAACSPVELNQLLGVAATRVPDRPVFDHRTLKPGQYLVRSGQTFESLYVINAGFFKTVFTDDCGNEQVMGFPMKGDLLGTDGIGESKHVNDIVALSDADIIVIPFHDLGALNQVHPGLDETLFRIISQQLIQEQLALTAIGALCAESRLARFLIKMGQQMERQGYREDRFLLRMSRQDLGNYLGMKIETVSRTLTILARKDTIRVNQREVTIVDRAALDDIARNGPVKNAPSVMEVRRKHVAASGMGSRSGGGGRVATPWSALTNDIDGGGNKAVA